MALVDLDRELYDRTVEVLELQLSDEARLLLRWILREHKIEVDQLKAEVAGFREANGVMGPMLHTAVSMALGVQPKQDGLPAETPEDIPDSLRPEILDEEEAMKRVNGMLAEVGEKPLDEDGDDPWAVPGCPRCGRLLGNPGDPCPNGCVAPSDTSGEHVDEEPAEATDERPKNWMQKNPIGPLNPAPIVTVEPEPFKPEGPVSDAEKARIRKLIGDQRCERLSGEQYALVVQLRMRKQTVSQIADAVGLQPASCGAYLRSADRHVTNLMAHPREEWRVEYMRQLVETVDAGRGAA